MALVRKRLGEILKEANMITEEQLQQALEEQKRSKDPVSIGQILVKNGYVTENNIKDALELQFGITYVNLNKVIITPEVLKMIPEHIIRQYQVIPVTFANNTLTIGMVDPTNLPAIDDVRLRLGKGMSVKTQVITEDDFYKLMNEHFKVEEKVESADEIIDQMVATDVALGEVEEDVIDDSAAARESETAPIIRLANTILVNALKKKASDIHIEPQEHYIQVRYRMDGILQKESQVPKKFGPALVSRFKIMSNLDIAEKRLPQDGRLRRNFEGKPIDFRVSTLPSKYGEKIVMRILDKSNTMMGIEKLFIFPDMLAQIEDMINRPYGIIFVTGPTGSGKTTSLYSILAKRNTSEVNITTAEDPIEYDLGGITQVQVRPEINLTFARVLKAFLRQDPDIMLIGETRDKEVAKIAIESALTGHLVFTSLHTNDAPGAVVRLQEMGVDGFLVASATIGVVAQRLVRRLCAKCKILYTPEYKDLDFVGYRYKPNEVIQFYQANPAGCELCSKGYKGRMGVYEVMQMNDDLRDLVNRNANKALIRYAAKEGGMVPLKDYALKLVKEGYTSLDEVIRVTLTDEGEEALCPNCRNPIGDEFIKCPFCQADLKKLCPSCNRELEENWKSCPSCGANLIKTEKLLKKVTPENAALAVEKCPTCLAQIQPDWVTCPYCHSIVRPGAVK